MQFAYVLVEIFLTCTIYKQELSLAFSSLAKNYILPFISLIITSNKLTGLARFSVKLIVLSSAFLLLPPYCPKRHIIIELSMRSRNVLGGNAG